MPNRDDDKTDAQKDYDQTAKQADRLKLKGKDRDEYIHRHMRGFGYRMVPSYVHPDDDDDEDEGGGFFKRSRRRNRDESDDDYPF